LTILLWPSYPFDPAGGPFDVHYVDDAGNDLTPKRPEERRTKPRSVPAWAAIGTCMRARTRARRENDT